MQNGRPVLRNSVRHLLSFMPKPPDSLSLRDTAMVDMNIDFENPSSPDLDSAESMFKFGDTTYSAQEINNPSILQTPIAFEQRIPNFQI